MKKLYSFVILLLFSLSLIGCSNDDLTYETGFPSKNSPALTTFMQKYLLLNYRTLADQKDKTTVTKINEGSVKVIRYFQISKDSLTNQYSSILGEKDNASLKKFLQNIEEKNEMLQQTEDAVNMPEVQLTDGNQIQLKTADGEKVISLKDHGLSGDAFIANMLHINGHGFILTIQNKKLAADLRENYYLFSNKDMSEVFISQLKPQQAQKVVDTGKLKPFYNILPSVNKDGKLKLLPNQLNIVNTETGKTKGIDQDDYLSNDGKYVYINGEADKLEDGEQQIQTTEDYIKGNDQYADEFTLDYDKIAKELKFKTSGIGDAQMNYFDSKFVVIRLKYNGRVVGDAGSTNVIVDLQKEEPVAYLVDLDIPGSERIY